MDISISSVSSYQASYYKGLQTEAILPRELEVADTGDTFQLGKSSLDSTQAMNMVVERAMEKLRSVVSDAKAALGISEDDTSLDTSPEATANRIADFALNFYDKWRANNTEGTEEEARSAFASFIGDAIQQGIGEASDILSALGALNSDVSGNISKTWDFVQARLDKFVQGEA